MRIIDVPYDFTSYEFYSNILPQIKISGEEESVLDMSFTRRIEPLVIPNLLCLAYQRKNECGIILKLLIPDTATGGLIRNYLNEIGFTKYAIRTGLFEFIQDPYGGLEGKKIDPICGTLVFNASDSRDDIYRGVDMCITPFSEEYLARFQIYDKDKYRYMNEITAFLEEILINCKIHAKSFSITTLHANYSTKKIYISVSDVGCGFLSTTEESGIEDEKQAILNGVYKRKNSKVYGLYNVIRRVLEYDGKVRIHSNDTQLVFTPRVLNEFKEECLENMESFEKYNVKHTQLYNGVHIEIELPLEKGNNNVHNR